MTNPRNAGALVIAAATLVLAGCPNDGTALTTEGVTTPGTDSSSSSGTGSSGAGTGEPTTSTTDPGPVTGEGTTDGTTTGTSSTSEPAATTTAGSTTGEATTGEDTTGGSTTGEDTTGGDTTGGDTTGCGHTMGGDTGQMGPPPPAELQWSHSQVKQFHFTWQPVVEADYYQLFESADGGPDFLQVGGDLCGTKTSITVPLHFRPDARYLLRSCNGDGCTDSAPVDVVGSLAPAVGYFKASNTGKYDGFGTAVALSADGRTLAVGAQVESSSATGIDGDQNNDDALNAGAVYVFVNTNGLWSQQAYIKASNAEFGDTFGTRVALSDDGNTLAVTADDEDSAATGINGDQKNGAFQSGAAYVFTRSGDKWSQQAYIKASNTEGQDNFGVSLSLSGDGNTLAVGADDEDSSATGIGGDQSDNAAEGAGAVYVFKRTGEAWAQQAYVKASNTEAGDHFGEVVALSTDGSTLAVSAPHESSGATGIDGDQADNSVLHSGAVYVFVRTNDVWSQQAYVKASNPDVKDWLGGSSLSLSGDGDTLAVATQHEDSAATGIDGDQNNNDAPNSGAVYVFAREGGVWSQTAYLKSSGSEADDAFGAVALSSDGTVLAVSAGGEDSAAFGINGDEVDNSLPVSGAAYVFRKTDGVWTQRAYVKAPNPDDHDSFGGGLALSGDGHTLAIGAVQESSKATGIGGDQANNTAQWSGAVYLY